MKPLCIELFCGTFGWSAGWLELGGRAVGFDIEHLPHHGPVPNDAELVLQDVLTLHGRQFKIADSKNRGATQKVPGFNFHQFEKTGKPGGSFQSAAVKNGGGGSWFPVSHGKDTGGIYGTNPVRGPGVDGVKLSGPAWFDHGIAQFSSGSPRRKAASAAIAKIPFELAYHIGCVYHPGQEAVA